MAGPAGAQPRGGFAPPTNVPRPPSPLLRPNIGGSPSLPGRRPGGWTPPAVDRGWARPPANLITDRSKTINPGNATMSNNRAFDRNGDRDRGKWTDDRDRHRADYGWFGYYSSGDSSGSYSSGYPYYGSYSSGDSSGNSSGSYSSGYSNYGSYSSGDANVSSGRLTDSGTSGSSYQPASNAPASRNEGAVTTDEEIWAAVKQRMDVARPAFEKGNYAEAQRNCQQAIKLLPSNNNLYEFRALCQFAQSDYKDSSVTLHEVLAGGPGWDWNTLSSFYTAAETYAKQLRALEKYVTEHPEDAAGRFVLAYHYLVLDERGAAVGQLQEVVSLEPRDRLAATIVEALKTAKNGKEVRADKPAPER